MRPDEGAPTADDRQLLREYAEQESETAFAELVRRHLDFVYGSALRRVGNDAHLAEDVSQQVFRALANQAAALTRREGLSGWLFVTTRNIAVQLVRSERRRHIREQEASIMNENPPATDTDWERLRPVLDEALDGLSDDDRTAVLMRFYEGRPFAEVGVPLRLAENAARMRVERALEKMRVLLVRRGVTSTGAALGLALANHAATAAPNGLAGAVTSAVRAKGAIAGAGRFLSAGRLMVGAAAALVIFGFGLTVQQAWARRAVETELAAIDRQTDEMQAKLRGLEGTLAKAEQRAQAADADAKQLLKAIQDAAPRVGLPPGDAVCLAFVIDTSGSMRSPKDSKLWSAVGQSIKDTLAANPDVSHVMALDSAGRNILSPNQSWISLTPDNVETLQRLVRDYDQDSISNPVSGIYRAMRELPPTAAQTRLRICVIGDEFNSGEQSEAVLRRLEELNPTDARGRRAASISAVQLPTTIRYLGPPDKAMGNTGLRFQALMTEVAKQHGGTYRLLPNDSLQ